jgi:Tfp pilus assembly protein PilN
MIKINLALRKTATPIVSENTKVGVTGLLGMVKGATGGGVSPSVSIRDLASLIGSVLVGCAVYYQVGEMKLSDLAVLQAEIEGLRNEQTKLKAETEKVATYEQLRKQVEADEKLIRSKLDTIKRLMENRNVPARLLMSLAQNIPADVWLKELRVLDKSVQFQGSALGFNQVSDFMKILGESPFLKAAELRGTEEGRFEGFEVKNFDLVAERK